jgi:hypothetical protein
VDNEQALLDRLAGDFGILNRFTLGHLGTMALGFGRIGWFGHDSSPLGLDPIKSNRIKT